MRTLFNNYEFEFGTVFGMSIEEYNKEYDREITEDTAYEEVDFYHNSEHEDLVSHLSNVRCNGLVGISSVGTWQGTRYGYTEVDNLVDIAYSSRGCDYMKLEVKRGNVHRTESHHDGTNEIEWREWRDDLTFEQRDHFLNQLYMNTATRNTINYYTISIVPLIKESGLI